MITPRVHGNPYANGKDIETANTDVSGGIVISLCPLH